MAHATAYRITDAAIPQSGVLQSTLICLGTEIVMINKRII